MAINPGKIHLAALVVAAVMLAACGGGVWPYALSPDRSPVAYVAFEDTTVRELYLVTLNPPMAGEGAWELQTSADSAIAYYAADQEQQNASELFLVEIANPGVSTAISDPAAADGFLADFTSAPGVRNP